MPIFTDRFVVEDLGDLSLSEFRFRTDLLDQPLIGYQLRRNKEGKHEFVSTETPSKLPMKVFGKRGRITLLDCEGNVLRTHVEIRERSFSNAKESQFKRLIQEQVLRNDNFVQVDCQLTYNQAEMDWILRGYVPIEMEDRIIMYAKDNRIFIYGSWNGVLMYEAQYYRKLFSKQYVINQLYARKRKVDFTSNSHLSNFQLHLESQYRTHRHYVQKWAQEYYEKNKLR